MITPIWNPHNKHDFPTPHKGVALNINGTVAYGVEYHPSVCHDVNVNFLLLWSSGGTENLCENMKVTELCLT